MSEGRRGAAGYRGRAVRPAAVSPAAASRSAADQLDRILFILPSAAREGGAKLDDLARHLCVTREDLVADITAVTTRAFYHPAGSGSDLQIYLSRDQVSAWTTGEFRRPVRLSLPEAVCLGLALRGAHGGHPRDTALAGLERTLASADPTDLLRAVDATDLRTPAASIWDTVVTGLQEKTAVRLSYCKPGDEAPSHRVVHPYALAHGEGQWYLLAHCQEAGEVRVFRFDRIMDTSNADASFRVPQEFDPEAYLQGHRIYRGAEEMEARVRYSPRIARWIAERESGEWDPEGGFTVSHQVADPRWIVRHVLQYGPDASVLEPPEARKWVREAVRPWTEALGAGPETPHDPTNH